MSKDRFPFVFKGGKITVTKVELFGVLKDRDREKKVAFSKAFRMLKDTLPEMTDSNDLKDGGQVRWLVHRSGEDIKIEFKNVGASKEETEWKLGIDKESMNQLEDILMLCHYSVEVLKKNANS
jgi:hypothetical protein